MVQEQRPVTPVGDLRAAATSGGFTVSEAGARPILAAIAACRADLAAREEQLRLISQRPSLGSSPTARAMSTHAQTVATGDEWSFETGVAKARTFLDELETGLRIAITGYADTDAESFANIRKADRS